ncbi:MAG: hypothetical protein IJX81_00385 [Clostridia bacterium]|nr:hypothetical protein [Clostridia bacterium]
MKASPKITGFTAKDVVIIAVFVAATIAVQLALSLVPGVELVTVLFAAFSFSYGVKRGTLAATAFSLLRQIVFGFYPTVLVLYLIYFNLFALLFGLLGKRLKLPALLPLIVVIACVCTVCFSLIDCVLTPLWYGYSEKATAAYFKAALPFTIPQVICTAVSVGVLFFPLYKLFKLKKLS